MRPTEIFGRILTVFTAGFFMLSISQVNAHDLKRDGDPANDWIEGLENSNGSACCGTNDCHPVGAGLLRSSPEGRLTIELEGRRFLVPKENILPESSPDGRAWACAERRPTSGGFSYRVEGVRCVLLPPSM